jgi:hypothetical protein
MPCSPPASRVEREVRDRLDQFVARHAVVQRTLEMERHFVDTIQRHEASHRDEAAVVRRKFGTFPHVAEQDIVGVTGERRRNVGKGISRNGRLVRHDDLLKL